MRLYYTKMGAPALGGEDCESLSPWGLDGHLVPEALF